MCYACPWEDAIERIDELLETARGSRAEIRDTLEAVRRWVEVNGHVLPAQLELLAQLERPAE